MLQLEHCGIAIPQYKLFYRFINDLRIAWSGAQISFNSVVKLCKLEEKYLQEKKQRSSLQKQISNCIQEKENYQKQKMQQVLLDLKVRLPVRWDPCLWRIYDVFSPEGSRLDMHFALTLMQKERFDNSHVSKPDNCGEFSSGPEKKIAASHEDPHTDRHRPTSLVVPTHNGSSHVGKCNKSICAKKD